MREEGSGQVFPEDRVTLHAGEKQLTFINGQDSLCAAKLGQDYNGPLVCDAFRVQVTGEHPPPRVGFKGVLAAGFENVEWFGRGPHESYVDRKAANRTGVFSGKIVDQTFKYIRPQENGNKEDTRWMALKKSGASACTGLLVSACPPTPTLGMQCHRYPFSSFDGPDNPQEQPIRHGGKLEEVAETFFCIDAAQMGLGGIDSWCHGALEQHMLSSSDSYSWSFRLFPLTAAQVASGAGGFTGLARGSSL